MSRYIPAVFYVSVFVGLCYAFAYAVDTQQFIV
jgi:hypothetical protein